MVYSRQNLFLRSADNEKYTCVTFSNLLRKALSLYIFTTLRPGRKLSMKNLTCLIRLVERARRLERRTLMHSVIRYRCTITTPTYCKDRIVTVESFRKLPLPM